MYCLTGDIRSDRFGFIAKEEIHKIAALERGRGVGITNVAELIRVFGRS
jgi:hypothetical protein